MGVAGALSLGEGELCRGGGGLCGRAKQVPFAFLAFFTQFYSTFWPNLGAIHVARPVVVLWCPCLKAFQVVLGSWNPEFTILFGGVRGVEGRGGLGERFRTDCSQSRRGFGGECDPMRVTLNTLKLGHQSNSSA